MDARAWRAALNSHLPASIRILSVREVPADFHARFNASGKVYEYLVCTDAVLSPFLATRAWHLPRPLNEELLSEALRAYEGEHDFRRFAARRGNEPEPPPPGFYRRHIRQATVRRDGSLLRLNFHGNGFMYRMVRLLTGTACQVALGRLSLDELRALLDAPPGPASRFCAPATGLYLDRVEYEGL